MLDPHRDADERLGNLERRARHTGVGHRPGNLDERLDAAERLREEEDPRAFGYGDRVVARASLEAQHASEPSHLPRGDVVARVIRQARVIDPGHLWVAGEGLGDALGARTVRFHPDRQGLYA